jgi:homoserine kinase
LGDALHNLDTLPFLLEALRGGDFKLLAGMLDDRLYAPLYRPHIPAYDHVLEMATRAGAQGVALVGSGPTLLLFSEANHRKLADAVRSAFRSAGVAARAWVSSVDTQGVVISVAQSA